MCEKSAYEKILTAVFSVIGGEAIVWAFIVGGAWPLFFALSVLQLALGINMAHACKK